MPLALPPFRAARQMPVPQLVVGGISASTHQGFEIQVPLGAQRLRYTPF
jgi:hypothetical protein